MVIYFDNVVTEEMKFITDKKLTTLHRVCVICMYVVVNFLVEQEGGKFHHSS